MIRNPRAAVLLLALSLSAVAANLSRASDADAVPFDELFVLERAKAMSQLLPGSPDHFYYRALDAQLRGDLPTAKQIMDSWEAARQSDGRLETLRLRQVFLTYDANPAAGRQELVRRLGLSFDHQPPGAPPPATALPSRLPTEVLDVERTLAQILERSTGLAEISDAQLPLLAGRGLSKEQRHVLLERIGTLGRADFPGLVDLISTDMAKDYPTFGQRRCDACLTLAQLQTLAKQRPALLGQSMFVEAVAARMPQARGFDTNADIAALANLAQFARTLPPAMLDHKAAALLHLLAAQERQGQVDRALLLEYLAIPRSSPLLPAEWQRTLAEKSAPRANLSATCFGLRPAAEAENALVERLLQRLFRDGKADVEGDANLNDFKPLLERDWLLRQYATAKFTAGQTEVPALANLLGPTAVKALRDQVTVRLLANNPRDLHGAAPEFHVALKHVQTLRVRVWRLDLAAYYRTHTDAEIDPALDLDGVTPSFEKTLTYADAPFLLHEEKIGLPELAEPGAYVVDFIGDGHSARAVVHQGRLQAFARPSAAGHRVSVMDGAGQPVANATVTMGAHAYATDKDGGVHIPYTRADREVGKTPLIISAGALATRLELDRQKEKPSFRAAFDLPRELLRGGERCPVHITPEFTINGQPADLGLLKDWRLECSFTLHDGTPVARRLDHLKPDDSGHLRCEVEVPAGAAGVSATLYARLPGSKPEEDVKLGDGTQVRLGENRNIAQWLMRRDGDKTVLELRGANGEPLAQQSATVTFRGGVFNGLTQRSAGLATDAQGRVDLGTLPEGMAITVQAPQAVAEFSVQSEDAHIPRTLCLAAGQAVRLPLATADSRWKPQLLRLQNGLPVEEMSAQLQTGEGQLALPGLAPGDYQLDLGAKRIALQVESAAAGQLIGQERLLQATGLAGSSGLKSYAIEGDTLVLRFAGAPEHLTLLAHRFADSTLPLTPEAAPAWGMARPRLANGYFNGRILDGEFRYILDRQVATLQVGNMLERPSLLLHPWDTRETQTGIQSVAPGFADDAGMSGKGGGWGGGQGGGRGSKYGGFPLMPLDFLAWAPALDTGVKVDAKGEVRIPLKALGDGNLLTLSASDGPTAWQRTLALPLRDLALRDVRVAQTLPLDQHLAEARNISLVKTGALHPLGGLTRAGARLETRGDLYRMLGVLNPNLGADWADFAPLTQWETLDDQAKDAFYAKHACHEVRFFIAQRDPAFFTRVIAPTLIHKKDKTFMDEVLLGQNIDRWIKPENLARLNAFERAVLARTADDTGLARHEQDVARQVILDPAWLDQLFRTATRNGQGGKDMVGLTETASKITMAGASLENGVGDSHASLRLSGGLAAPAAATAPAVAASMTADRAERKADAAKRSEMEQQAEALYHDPGAAKEWAEHNWWHTLRHVEHSDLIGLSAFWADYAASGKKAAFFSPHLLLAHTSLHEALLALAVVDLPAVAKPVEIQKGATPALKAGSDLLMVESVLKPDAAAAKEVFVQQRFFAQADRQTIVDGQPRLKVHRGPYRPGTVYGCELVVSNPGEVARRVSVLRQIPAGALAVGGNTLDAPTLELPAYGCARMEYFFYFPAEGEFKQYPAQAAEQGHVIGAAEPASFAVSRSAPAPLDNAFAELAAHGSAEAVLAFLKDKDLAGLDLSLLAHRLRDKGAYAAITAVLRERRYFEPTLWSYSLLHGDDTTLAEYLPTTALAQQIGPWFEHRLLSVDAVRQGTYEHLEYSPFINARMLALDGEKSIPHAALRLQYARLLEILRHKPALSADDHLALAYYLGLQDRVTEAQAHLDAASADGVAARMQHDYFRCWLLFSAEKPAEAKAIAVKWADCPLTDWRRRFAEVVSQADAIAAGALAGATPDAAAKAAALDAYLEQGQLQVQMANLAGAQVALYPLDLEVQFSRQPFALQDAGTDAPPVRPARVLAITPDAKGHAQVALPAELARQPMLLEVSGGGLRRLVPYQPHAFDLQMMEAQGQLQVSIEGKPCPKAYVKVYAKMQDGSVRFHKDGTTDLRGRFDYAALNTGLAGCTSLAVLVVAPGQNGACVRVVDVPKE